MPISKDSFLRQLSGKEAWESASRRWTAGESSPGDEDGDGYTANMEGLYGMYDGGGYGGDTTATTSSKRVMVVVDETSRSKHAMMWALTHVTNKGDFITLLHVVSPHHHDASLSSSSLAHSLGSLCKACKPEVEVEALVIQGPKLATVLSQVKKLEASVLVLGQKKPSPLISCLCGLSRSEAFVDDCINGADCLTIGVRKQSNGVSGYLINTRWQKNFWLLA
ncbi:PREDICTED: uncharacterized protein LOC104817291 [Tarenaya hassleriana]|uniref:uncharacterized protein LOC104817291 n=1 Tax=Tarenaya hassleriana TaxID=28532 RepID=UPI00053C2C66|nr:PREDICTED: uncharacterized protein LOC104817291 [Tarenaya hassleriana]